MKESGAGNSTSGPGKPVVVADYDHEWPGWFSRAAYFVDSALRGFPHRIEHVGSTSVPGMAAKPVIDIDVVVEPGGFEAAKERLSALGYRHQGDLGMAGREAFELADSSAAARLPAHNLYVCESGAAELRRHTAFRDFLKSSPEWASRLSRLKKELAARGLSMEEYMAGKAAMVGEITGLACEASRKQGESCMLHASREAAGRCSACGALVCGPCDRSRSGEPLCPLCSGRTRSYGLGRRMSLIALAASLCFNAAMVLGLCFAMMEMGGHAFVSLVALIAFLFASCAATLAAFVRERMNVLLASAIVLTLLGLFNLLLPVTHGILAALIAWE